MQKKRHKYIIKKKKKDRIYRNTVLLKSGLKVKYCYTQCSETIQLPKEFL